MIPKQVIDISGKVFGRLKVLHFVDTIKLNSRGAAGARWLCRCECGNEIVVLGTSLRRGNTKSCGCLEANIRLARNTRHGAAARGEKSREYIVYRNMLARCYNPKSDHYARYGGRGIGVCDRWRFGEDGKHGYTCFLEDIGPRPSPKHSIDRIENSGPYAPGNVRWAIQVTQVRNSTKATIINTPQGEMSITEAAERFGIAYGALRSRLRMGWPVLRALTEPTASLKTIVVRGEAMTMEQAAALSPVGMTGIRLRLKKGWTPDEAVFLPKQRTGPKSGRDL